MAAMEDSMTTDATPAKVRLTDGLGPDPQRDCLHGQLASACDRCADAREIAELRAALLDARDCRTCRNFTTRSGGCVSVLRCVDGSGYKRQGRFHYWEAAPLDPAPF